MRARRSFVCIVHWSLAITSDTHFSREFLLSASLLQCARTAADTFELKTHLSAQRRTSSGAAVAFVRFQRRDNLLSYLLTYIHHTQNCWRGSSVVVRTTRDFWRLRRLQLGYNRHVWDTLRISGLHWRSSNHELVFFYGFLLSFTGSRRSRTGLITLISLTRFRFHDSKIIKRKASVETSLRLFLENNRSTCGSLGTTRTSGRLRGRRIPLYVGTWRPRAWN